jgi:small subunit ribosomal protein S8
MNTDPIADMLTRIRNAISVRKREVVLPHSNIKETVAKTLASANFIDRIEVTPATVGKQLKIVINSEDANARITEIERLSKPGRRLYVNADEIPSVQQGRGIVIISTSKGVMTGREAKKQRLGGELICKVY